MKYNKKKLILKESNNVYEVTGLWDDETKTGLTIIYVENTNSYEPYGKGWNVSDTRYGEWFVHSNDTLENCIKVLEDWKKYTE